MRIVSRDDSSSDVEVQMAPLIDCMFLLLVFFLVAATLKKINKELDITLPEADVAISVAEEPDVLVLGVDAIGNFYVNGNRAGRELILAKVAEANQNNYPVRLDGDRNARYQDIIELVALCRMRGVKNVSLQTQKYKNRP